MKKVLVIMGTHPNGLKTFDSSRTDCDIWMFNKTPNVKIDGKLMYPRTGRERYSQEAKILPSINQLSYEMSNKRSQCLSLKQLRKLD